MCILRIIASLFQSGDPPLLHAQEVLIVVHIAALDGQVVNPVRRPEGEVVEALDGGAELPGNTLWITYKGV